MSYTVKKLAKISGVSVRTLHFYDEMGLLKPAYYGENGYRHYEEEQLFMLQQILFFRELGFELKQIRKVLSRTDFDKIEALKSHKRILQQGLERTQKLIQTIDKTIVRLKGKSSMSDPEMYYGFSKEKQEEYEKYVITRFGNKAQDLVSESKRNVKNWKKEDWDKMKGEGDNLHRELAQAIEKKLKANSKEVQSLIRRHFQLIQRFYNPPREVYAGLGQLYVEHPDFRKLYDSFHPKLAEFMAEAMKVFADRELS